jgi:hypothetical protein
MSQYHVASGCPQNKCNGYQYEKQFFVEQRTFEKINDDDPDSVKGVEKNNSPQPHLKEFKQW